MKTIRINPQLGDMTPVVFRALQDCEDGDVISLSPGDYHFHPEFAFKKYYFISNNRHGLKRVAFPVIDKQDVTIDGNGAHLIFHGEIIPFVVENSRHITLRNFCIDWERPFYSQGTVTAADASGVNLKIDRSSYPYRIEEGNIIFEGEGWESGFCEGVFAFDPKTRAPAYLSGDSMGLGFPQHIAVEDLGDSRVRLAESFPQLPKQGQIVVLRHYNRHCPGIHLKTSQYILLERVTLHHAGGMGIIGQFCEDVTVRDCRVTPSGDRIFSVTADASHFVNCRGTIHLENCLFENQLDDPTNVHGINTRVKEVVDSHSFITELVHHEQHGVEIGFAGDRVQFTDNTTLLSYADNEIESVEWISEQLSKTTFKQELPERLQSGHVMENMSWTPGLHIHGCTCRNNRARGYLISTPGKVVVENNQIEASGAGIKISGDANSWFESGAVRDVLIRNNHFGDCCYGDLPWGRAVIDIDPEIPSPLGNGDCFHRNIRIENNTFCTFDAGIIFARSVDGIRFSGNTLQHTDSYPNTGRNSAVLTFKECRHIDVKDNNADDFLYEEWIRTIEAND